jgi:hypothetical protein
MISLAGLVFPMDPWAALIIRSNPKIHVKKAGFNQKSKFTQEKPDALDLTIFYSVVNVIGSLILGWSLPPVYCLFNIAMS